MSNRLYSLIEIPVIHSFEYALMIFHSVTTMVFIYSSITNITQKEKIVYKKRPKRRTVFA